MKVGDILIARNSCNMEDDGRPTLTIGKEYKVVYVSIASEWFTIIDDEGDEHEFTNDTLGIFFKVKKEDPIVNQVIEKFKQRSKKGIQTYGKTLHDNNTDDFLTHLQEELMDAVLYIQKLKDGNDRRD